MPDPVRQPDSALTAGPASWHVDDFVESYVSWREEAMAVQTAYDHWRSVHEPDEALAFAAYRAALEREEHAANLLCRSAGRISPEGR
jgi:hypothetical protein